MCGRQSWPALWLTFERTIWFDDDLILLYSPRRSLSPLCRLIVRASDKPNHVTGKSERRRGCLVEVVSAKHTRVISLDFRLLVFVAGIWRLHRPNQSNSDDKIDCSRQTDAKDCQNSTASERDGMTRQQRNLLHCACIFIRVTRSVAILVLACVRDLGMLSKTENQMSASPSCCFLLPKNIYEIPSAIYWFIIFSQ